MKYKIGDNVILNDDVEFWFKKVGGCEVSIVDTTSCSYKIKIGENQYVFIDDNSINHKATSELKNKFRYKVGDRVKTLEKIPYSVGADEVANQIYTIEEVDAKDERLPYRINHRGWLYWINDDCIDHEATTRLNEPKYELITDDNGVYLTSQLLEPLINSTTNKEDIKKGSDKMNEIRLDRLLTKWKNKKIDTINAEQEQEIEKVTKSDEIRKLVTEHEEEINKTIKEKFKVDTQVGQLFIIATTDKTQKKVDAIRDKYELKRKEVEVKENEIVAVLNAVESEEKIFDILIKQKIIDNNYNIL